MQRVALSLPLCLLGLPVLVSILVAAPRPEMPESSLQFEEFSPELAPPAVLRPSKFAQSAPSAPTAPTGPPDMERLARESPTAFLEACLVRYCCEVEGYSLKLWKHEVINGKNLPVELAEVYFCDQPHSVYFHWLQGAGRADSVLFKEGENKDRSGKSQMLARPSNAWARRLCPIAAVPVDGADAKQSGRYPLNEFGFKKNMQRTLKAWKTGLAEHNIRIDYEGIRPIPQLAERPCFVLHAKSDLPEPDGVTELICYIDKETWLQTGSILKKQDGTVLGEYYFREVRLNPEFKPGQFKPDALK